MAGLTSNQSPSSISVVLRRDRCTRISYCIDYTATADQSLLTHNYATSGLRNGSSRSTYSGHTQDLRILVSTYFSDLLDVHR